MLLLKRVMRKYLINSVYCYINMRFYDVEKNMKTQKTALFVPGQIVCMKSNNNKWGVVISSIYSEKEFIHSVVMNHNCRIKK